MNLMRFTGTGIREYDFGVIHRDRDPGNNMFSSSWKLNLHDQRFLKFSVLDDYYYDQNFEKQWRSNGCGKLNLNDT